MPSMRVRVETKGGKATVFFDGERLASASSQPLTRYVAELGRALERHRDDPEAIDVVVALARKRPLLPLPRFADGDVPALRRVLPDISRAVRINALGPLEDLATAYMWRVLAYGRGDVERLAADAAALQEGGGDVLARAVWDCYRALRHALRVRCPEAPPSPAASQVPKKITREVKIASVAGAIVATLESLDCAPVQDIALCIELICILDDVGATLALIAGRAILRRLLARPRKPPMPQRPTLGTGGEIMTFRAFLTRRGIAEGVALLEGPLAGASGPRLIAVAGSFLLRLMLRPDSLELLWFARRLVCDAQRTVAVIGECAADDAARRTTGVRSEAYRSLIKGECGGGGVRQAYASMICVAHDELPLRRGCDEPECGAVLPPMPWLCGGCKRAVYCGARCQRRAWGVHAHLCRPVRRLLGAP